MSPAADLARHLARSADAVCRHYLPAGKRQGRYWLVGDVANSAGRSLFVRLTGPDQGAGAAGRWTDAATGAYGDLLDLIAACEHLTSLADTLAEARRFLHDAPAVTFTPPAPAPRNSSLGASRLFAAARPLAGTLGATYLRMRGLTTLPSADAVRFHPCCYRRSEPDDAVVGTTWPALIAAVADASGTITGVQRTWLDPSGRTKAPVASPRRMLGPVLGHGVRLGATQTTDVLAIGEGLETMLSVHHVIPIPAIAAGSAAHLQALVLPSGVRRVYIALDRDPAGWRAAAALIRRATGLGIDAVRLTPKLGDLNDDLVALGRDGLADLLYPQLRPEDRARFLGR